MRRIYRVMDYIETHLADDLNLELLAGVASFSPFHFHRLFSALTGETLNNHIRRIRLERAAALLMDKRPDTISDIAFACGFSGNAVFSRSFGEHFGMSPTTFRNGGYREIGKNRKLIGNNRQQQRKQDKPVADQDNYFRNDDNQHKKSMPMKVDVKEMPEMHVAYVRHIGNYSQVGAAFEKLMRWAGPRGLLAKPDTRVVAVYHDDPGVTEEDKLRTSVCVTLPDHVPVTGELGTMKVAGGTYACGHFELSESEFTGAWTAMMRDWLPESGFVCDDKPPYELYLNNHMEHPQKKHIVDICIPVRPM